MHRASPSPPAASTMVSRVMLRSSGSDIVGKIEEGPSVDATDIKLVLVGVMTSKKYVGLRTVAAHDTWVPSIPGEVGSRNVKKHNS